MHSFQVQHGGRSRRLARYPTSEERKLKNGASQSFENGQIHWHAGDNHTHATHGAIQSYWASQNWENGWLGYPTSDEQTNSKGASQQFQGGEVFITKTAAPFPAFRQSGKNLEEPTENLAPPPTPSQWKLPKDMKTAKNTMRKRIIIGVSIIAAIAVAASLTFFFFHQTLNERESVGASPSTGAHVEQAKPKTFQVNAPPFTITGVNSKADTGGALGWLDVGRRFPSNRLLPNRHGYRIRIRN